VMSIINQFSADYGKRFGEGSQAPEAGIRINTVRVSSFVELDTVHFKHVRFEEADRKKIAAPKPVARRECLFPGHASGLETAIYKAEQFEPGMVIEAPAVVIAPTTTYLVEPGWRLTASEQGAIWLTRVK